MCLIPLIQRNGHLRSQSALVKVSVDAVSVYSVKVILKNKSDAFCNFFHFICVNFCLLVSVSLGLYVEHISVHTQQLKSMDPEPLKFVGWEKEGTWTSYNVQCHIFQMGHSGHHQMFPSIWSYPLCCYHP